MKRFIIVLILITVSNIFAQVNTNFDGVKPEVKAGAKSLVFSYIPFQSNLGALTSGTIEDEDMTLEFQGIGLKIFPTNRFSILLNFGIGSVSIDGEGYENSAGYFATGFDFDYHFKSLYSVSTYIGGNLNFNRISSEGKQGNYKTEYSSITFGTGLNFGFDWYFTEGISLGGKYTYNFIISPEDETKTSSGKYEGPSYFGSGVGIGGFVLYVHFE